MRTISYILTFATGDKRENITCGIKAYARIKDKIRHNLFIVGVPKGKFFIYINHKCRNLGILERVKIVCYTEKDALFKIYRDAALYVDTTLFEGFGLQVLEAMTFGLPVIASRVDSLPEIVGNAGILVEPCDDAKFAEEIFEVLNNTEKARTMSNASKVQAEKFSWIKAATQTVSIYNKVLCQEYQ